MDVLRGISDAVAGIVAAVGPSVVRVEGGRRLPATGIAWAADGTVVTAEHVVERDEDLRIGLADGQTVAAELVGRDPTTDLAVLRAQASALTVPRWADLEGAGVGQLVLALGRPGRTVRARMGIISALGETWRAPTGGEIGRYVESDIRLGPGFSGGPLVDAAGSVIGLNTAGLLRHAALAVPAVTMRRVVDALRTHGRIRRGYLGIGGHPVRLPAPMRERTGQTSGLIIIAVEPGSPAERAGMVLGDVVLTLAGEPVRFPDDVAGRLGADAIGKAWPLRIARGGEIRELSITVGERS